MKKEIICTVCPMGCHITVEGEDERISSVSGYTCRRGEQYASNEFTHPVRILTSTVRTDSAKLPVLPVRSAKPVPKEQLFAIMEKINAVTVSLPVAMHQVIIPDVCGTGVDIVSTVDAK